MEVDADNSSAVQAESAFDLRDAATALYKKGSYAEAVTAYTRALSALGSPPSDSAAAVAILSNRAAASVMLKRYSAASADCGAALAFEPKNCKAAMRKATSDIHLGDIESAIALYSLVLGEDATNSAAKKEKLAAQGLWKKMGEARGAHTAKDHATTAKVTESLLTFCSASYEIKTMRAGALLGLGRLQEALDITTQMISGDSSGPDAAPVLILRAKILNYQVR